MASANVAGAKLLFVISSDYGELLHALYFLQDQPFPAAILAPPHLADAMPARHPVPCQTYSSVADVLAAVDRFRPEVVFLFSGYLYVTNTLFTLPELALLVDGLTARRVRVVTSDPFLGLMAGIDENTFDALEPPVRKMLAEEYSQVHRVVGSLTHLYLVEPAEFVSSAHAVSFSNPQFQQRPTFVPSRAELLAEIRGDPARPRWLFVLSNMDYWFSAGRYGGPRFDDVLTDRLREAAQLGRQPVLLAPYACTSAITLRDPHIDGLILLNQCRLDLYLALLLEADYAFYWNIFSTSLLVRSLHRLPVFFFDSGHMARCCSLLRQRGLQHYYGTEEISYLDMSQPLQPSALAAGLPEQQVLLAGLKTRVLRSPSPVEMVQRLVSVS
jgi:hypothetical protein